MTTSIHAPRTFPSKSTLLFVLTLLLTAASSAQCAKTPYGTIQPTRIFDPIQPAPGPRTLVNPLLPAATSPLQIVALGDSVMWGNGLQNPNKFVTLVGHQVANKTQREVLITSFAHSGAKLIETNDDWAPVIASDNNISPGDLNAGAPTTDQQADCAASTNPNAEIVFVDGCINEVGALSIALPFPLSWTSESTIATDATKYCSQMTSVLQHVQTSFPNAIIIVLNYYRVVSGQSSLARVVPPGTAPGPPPGHSSDKEVKRLLQLQAKVIKQQPAHGRLAMIRTTSQPIDDSAIRAWDANSSVFLDTSKGCFQAAIAAANGAAPAAQPDAAPSCPPPDDTIPHFDPATPKSRVYLAQVPVDPQYSYGAPEKRLWSLPVTILFFWTIHKDDMYGARKHICATHYDNDLDEYVCSINPIAHPDRDGANAYALSIAGSAPSDKTPAQMGILDYAWAPKP